MKKLLEKMKMWTDVMIPKIIILALAQESQGRESEGAIVA